MNSNDLKKLKESLKGLYDKKAMSLSLAMVLMLSGFSNKINNDISKAKINEKTLVTSTDFEFTSADKPITIVSDTVEYDESIYNKPASESNRNNSLNIYFDGDLADQHELTIEEKFEEVRIAYGLTYEKLDTICAVFATESFYMKEDADGNKFEKGADHEDARHVTSVLLNRLHTKRYVDAYGTDAYNQMINGGYQPFNEGTYKKYLGRIDLPVYQAVIEVLHSQSPVNNMLEFRAPMDDFKKQYSGKYIQPVNGGNVYIDSTDDEVMIDYEFYISDGKQLIL